MKKDDFIIFDKAFVENIISQYAGFEDSQRLLRQFAKKYGDIKFCEIFRFCHLHLRGKKLTLYFSNHFIRDRFVDNHTYDDFINYCQKNFDFKIMLEENY